MQKLLIHITILFALIMLLCTPSAYGQGAQIPPKKTIQLDTCVSIVMEQYAVDLGLDVYWADRNVGADTPQDADDYFAWGETNPKGNYVWTTYKYDGGYDFIYGQRVSKYTTKKNQTNKSKVDGYTTLLNGHSNPVNITDNDDAASYNWGGYWRMPTKSEYNDLVSNTNFQKTNWTSPFQYTFYNPTDNTLSITFSCEGFKWIGSVTASGVEGYFWTSSLNTNDNTKAYRFKIDGFGYYINTYLPSDEWTRQLGFSIRAVIDKCKNVSIKAQYPESISESTIAPGQSYTSNSYPKGTILEAKDIPCYNYQWYRNDTIVEGGYNSDIEITKSNATYKVVYEKKMHEITTSTNPIDGSYGSAEVVNKSSNDKYESCSTIQLKATPQDSCYYFVKWVETKGSEQPKEITTQTLGYTCSTTGGVNTLEVVVDTTASYVAHFERYDRTLKVTSAAGGSASILNSEDKQVTVKCDSTLTIVATPDDCHTFLYWTKNGQRFSGDDSDTITVTVDDNDIYKAIYQINQYTVTTQVAEGQSSFGQVTQFNNPIDCGTKITLKATPQDSCYYFVKWVETKGGEQPKEITTQTQGYTCSTTGGVNTLEVVVDATASYVAHFGRYDRTLKVTGAVGGSASILNSEDKQVTVKCDSTLTIVATPDACYTFGHWIKHVEGQADDTISASTPTNGVYTLKVPVSEDATYTAVFKKLKYKITAEEEDGQKSLGTVTSPTDSTECGENVTLIATATDCSEFVHWYRMDGENKVTFTPESYGDAISCKTNGKTDTLVVKADANETYIAVFKKLKYKITAEVEDGQNTLGTITSPTDSTDCDEHVTLTATATDCSEFVHWYRMDGENKVTFTPESYGDAISCKTNGKTDTLVVKADANETYIAVFKKLKYKITAEVEDGQNTLGTITSPTDSTDCDEHVTLTATATDCSEFVHWYRMDGENKVTFTPESYGDAISCKTNGKTDTLVVKADANETYIAVFKKLKYKITAEVEDGQKSLGTVTSPTDSTDCDEHVTLTATATDCSEFVHWYRMDGENKVTFTPESYGDAISCQTNGKTDTLVVKADANETYIAVFSSATYSVDLRVDALGGGHVDGPSTSGCDSITITAVPDSCYRFVRWENDETNPERIVNISSDTSFTAWFEPIQYAITTKENIAKYGEATASPDTVTCAQDAKVKLTATPTSSCYYLKEWIKVGTPDSIRYYINHNGTDYTCNTDENGVNTLIVPVTDDAEYIAIFALEAFEINATCDKSQGSISIEGDYTCEKDVTLKATPHECFQFVQWQDTVSGTIYPADSCTTKDGRSYTLTLPVTGDAGYVATFEKRKVKITLIAEEGGSVIGGGDFYCDTTITLTARPKDCYHFVKWSDEQTDTVRTYTVEGYDTLRAYFARDTFAIQVQGSEGGSVDGSGNYACGETVTLKATAYECYHFVKWSDEQTDSVRNYVVEGNDTLHAYFARDTFAIQVQGSEGGSVSGSGNYACGDTITLKATAYECYHFVKWSDEQTDSVRNYVVEGNDTLYAYFARDTFAIQVEGSEGGSVDGSGNYACGDTITLKATAYECYHFVKWSDEQTDSVRNYVVEGNDTLHAYFARDTFAIQVQGSEGGTATGSGNYACGDTAILKATAEECYQFVKWSDDNTANPRSVVVTKDEQYEAEFEIIKYTISIDPDDPKKGSTVFVTNPNQ